MTGTTRREDGQGKTGDDTVGDSAPLSPEEQQHVTKWWCIHPETQLNANKRGKRIEGFLCDKWLKEISMSQCMERWVP